jgi:AraC family transcriptional regulator
MEIKIQQIIATTQVRIFIGKNCITNFTKNDTPLLWQSFMPMVKAIPHRINNHLFAIDTYPAAYSFEHFDPQINFTKWACVEIDAIQEKHQNMEILEVPASLFAVFEYTGTAAEAGKAFDYIFSDWMKKSPYAFDATRPFFCEMNANYNPVNPEEKELIWIPIQLK